MSTLRGSQVRKGQRGRSRTPNVHTLIAVGVNVDEGCEVLGLDVAPDEDSASWRAAGVGDD
nr:transposase [Micromonospora gifhornensis]